jgi:hypothetical protein
MWIVLGAAAVVVVLVVVVVAFRRPRADDLHSVRSYHSALGTLENMSDRPGQPASGPTGSPDRSSVGHVSPRFYSRATAGRDAGPRGDLDAGPAAAPPGSPGPAGPSGAAGHSQSVPPVPLRDLEAVDDPATPLVFDDARPDRHATLPAAQESPEIAPAVRLDRAQRHALESMNRRPRRITAVSIVVVAVVVFAVLAVVGSRRANSPHHAPSASATTSAHSGRSTTPTTAHGAKAPPAKKKAKTHTPPTTVPTQLVALSSTSTSATYSVPNDTYTVTVSASGPCWVGATTVATGSTLWEGTLQAGNVQVIRATGVVTVQLGTTAATIKVGKLPVILPSPLHSPFLATFQTPAAASASTTTTTTTGATGATTSTTAAPSAG